MPFTVYAIEYTDEEQEDLNNGWVYMNQATSNASPSNIGSNNQNPNSPVSEANSEEPDANLEDTDANYEDPDANSEDSDDAGYDSDNNRDDKGIDAMLGDNPKSLGEKELRGHIEETQFNANNAAFEGAPDLVKGYIKRNEELRDELRERKATHKIEDTPPLKD